MPVSIEHRYLQRQRAELEGRRGRASSAQHSDGLLVICGAQWPVGQLLGETDAWPCPEDPDRRYGRVLGRRPGARPARRAGWRWTVYGHTACLRPGFVCAAPKNLDRRSCSSLEALMVLAPGARGAARTWSRALVAMFNDPKKAFQPTGSP